MLLIQTSESWRQCAQEVISVQGALKTYMGRLRFPDCLARFVSFLSFHAQNKILEVQRIVERVLANDKPARGGSLVYT